MNNLFFQRCVLACAILFTSWGIVRVGLLPSSPPMPDPISPIKLQALRLQGWKVSTNVRAQRRPRLSNAEGYVFVNSGDDQVKKTQLSLVPVRARTSENLDPKDIASVVLGKSLVNYKFRQIRNDTFLLSLNERDHWLASTCIVAGRISASKDVLATTLGRLPVSLLERFNTLLGLRPPRNWSCLFATIRVAGSQDFDHEIDETLRLIRPVFVD